MPILTEELLLTLNGNNLVMLDYFRAHDLIDQDYDTVIDTLKSMAQAELARWLVLSKDNPEYFINTTPYQEVDQDAGWVLFDSSLGIHKNYDRAEDAIEDIAQQVYNLLTKRGVIQLSKRLTNSLGQEVWIPVGRNLVVNNTATQIVINNLVDQELLVTIRASMVTVPKNPG
jgi:hypothetical protein